MIDKRTLLMAFRPAPLVINEDNPAQQVVFEDDDLRIVRIEYDPNAPTNTVTTTGEVAEDGTGVAIGMLAAYGSGATYVPQTDVAGSYGTFSLTEAGGWRYTLDNQAAQALGAAETATEAFVTASSTGAEQTVTITVRGSEDAPVIAGNAVGAVAEDGTLVATGSLSVSDADGGDDPAFVVQSGTAGQYGAFDLTEAGAWTYTLDNAAAQVLTAGQTVTETFTAVAMTADGESVQQTVTVTIEGAADAAVITGTFTGDVVEDGTNTATGTLSVTGGDSGGNPSFVAQTGTAGQYGAFSLTSAGVWSYTLDNGAAQGFSDGDKATDDFIVTVTSDGGPNVTQVVTITITGAEDAPVITGTASGSVAEDGTPTASGKLTVIDADTADAPTFGGTSSLNGLYGAFTFSPDGSWTYTLDNDRAQALSGGQSVTDTLGVTASTADGEEVQQTITVSITGAEDGPMIAGTATGAVVEDGATAASGTLSVTDADGTDSPAFTAQTDTPGLHGLFNLTTAGAWTYALNNASAQPLAGGEVVTEAFTAVATTSDGETVQQTVSVTVAGSEDGPVISGTSTGAVTEDDTLSASGTLAVADADGNDSPTFTAQSDVQGLYGMFSLTTAGAWSYVLDNDAAQELDAGQAITETFTATATTADGETVEHSVTITVHGAEDAPPPDPLEDAGLIGNFDAEQPVLFTLDGNGAPTEVGNAAENSSAVLSPVLAGAPLYSSSEPRAGGKPALVWPDTMNDLGLTLGFDAPCSEVFIVACYKDGLDSTFDSYNTIVTDMAGMAGNGVRIFGRSGGADIGAASVVDTVSINGAAPNNLVLPLPLSLVRISSKWHDTPGTPINVAAIGAPNKGEAGRSWQGIICQVVAYAADAALSDQKIAEIEAHLMQKWGIS